ncbi:MAG: class I SAM-dependent methyltransferase [Bryobacteraceae bacterium]
MQTGQPSRTARGAAIHRAVHQVAEQGRIFADPLAMRILGEDVEALAGEAADHPHRRGLRLFIAVRTRFAEDALAAAVERGVAQLVVLGAGLDTYAYRGAMREGLRIFEVDHPATQSWKRARLAQAGIPVPANLTFAPLDLERQTLSDGLSAAGFDGSQPSFFTWLGVVPYLTEEVTMATLGFIAGLPGGAQVVFDYSNPPDSLGGEMRALDDTLSARVAQIGEAWVSYFESDTLHGKLLEFGFREIEDLGPAEIRARYFPQRAGAAPAKGGHVIRAAALARASRGGAGG